MATQSNQPEVDSNSVLHLSPGASEGPGHKRTYQACIPCRRRKVRCDLGSVDDPHDPPCVRCRRESKDCFFSATRRKRKADGREDDEDEVKDEYAARNRRRTSLTGSGGGQHLARGRAPESDQSETPPSQLPDIEYGDSGPVLGRTPKEQEVSRETAANLFQSPIHNPGDALHLLFEAAGRSGDLNYQNGSEQRTQQSSSQRTRTRSINNSHIGNSKEIRRSHQKNFPSSALDPAITMDLSNDNPSYIDALRAWDRLLFVRAGLFTAKEAIAYIDYFYRFLYPMTPITPPNFHSLASQRSLIDEEPMLTVTMLTLTSRYMQLTGAGAQTRSYYIHERLWEYLQNMISRMFWGQEQFGGGFCGAGVAKTQDLDSLAPADVLRTGGLGSMGSIESLLLLTEWHPRAMHFPSPSGVDELVRSEKGISLPEQDSSKRNGNTESWRRGQRNSGDSSGWAEPAWRSDRMCWSLLGTAVALAYELGVLNDVDKAIPTGATRSPRLSRLARDQMRSERIRRLLYTYTSQTSGRLGYANMLPSHIGQDQYCKVTREVLHAADTHSRDLSDATQRCWAEIACLMRATNESLFSTRAYTTHLIKSGQYLQHLEKLQPSIKDWKEKLDTLKLPKYSRLLLLIEYQYMRVYINSLALQAVLEQWSDEIGTTPTPNVTTPGALLSSSLAGFYKQNEFYIREVIEASRDMLRCVVDGLLPNDHLKHAPVRTHFRILSGCMFLLKTLALGAKEDEVAISLRLLDKTVAALRTSVVDDVHLCLRIADLLSSLTSSIRGRFVRLAAPQKPAEAQHMKNKTRQKQNPLEYHPQRSIYSDHEAPAGNPPGDSSNNNYYSPTSSNPLAGISSNPIDLNDSSITIMPPPEFSYNLNYPYDPQYINNVSSDQQQSYQINSNMTFPDSNNTGDYTPDWLALPLDPLLSNLAGGSGANQGFGGLGPGMGHGNFDMLEVLLNEYQGQGGADMAF